MLTLIAQANDIPLEGFTADISPIANLGQLIETAASAILLVGALATLVYLFLGAFKWVTAGGEKGKVEEGRTMMTQAVIGLVVLASVFAIYQLVLGFLGLGERINLGGAGGTGATQLTPTNPNLPGRGQLGPGGNQPVLPITP